MNVEKMATMVAMLEQALASECAGCTDSTHSSSLCPPLPPPPPPPPTTERYSSFWNIDLERQRFKWRKIKWYFILSLNLKFVQLYFCRWVRFRFWINLSFEAQKQTHGWNCLKSYPVIGSFSFMFWTFHIIHSLKLSERFAPNVARVSSTAMATKLWVSLWNGSQYICTVGQCIFCLVSLSF